MPLDEEGAKWSCEPCVRGHRSSKCQHFDRLMMKVPKAGRPLAKCPHPKGTCSCQKLYAFMVRIPKGSTCLCRPLYKLPMVVTDTGQPTPAVPGMTTAPNNPQTGQDSISAHPSLQDGHKLGTLEELAAQTDANISGGMNFSLPPGKQPYPSQHTNFAHPSQSYPVYNGVNNSTLHGPQPVPHTPVSQANIAMTQTLLHQNNGAINQPEPKPETKKCGSCACHKPDKDINSSESNTTTQPKVEDRGQYPSHLNRSYGPVDGHALGWKQEDISSPGNPISLHNYRFNSFQNPGQGVVSSFHSTQPAPAPPHATYTAQNTTQMPNNLAQGLRDQYIPSSLSEHRLGAPSIFSYDPAHNCNCGDGCQCLGCASHPYNDTTRQHIQEMGYIMTMDEHDGGSERSQSRGHTLYGEQMSPTPGQYPTFPDNSFDFAQASRPEPTGAFSSAMTAQGFDHDSVTPTSAAYGSGYNQMMMQPSAYYTVEYPVGEFSPCTDLTGTCQCGSDCSCVGCLTHSGHNGLSLQSPQQPNTTNPQIPAGPLVQSSSPYVQTHGHTVPLDYSSRSPESQRPVDPNPV